MKHKKILHVMADADAGGMSSVVCNLYSHLDRERYHFDIALTTDSFGINGKKLEALGCTFYRIPLKSKNKRGYKEAIRNLLAEGKYDAIHVHENETSFVALRIAKKCGVKCRVAHSHSSAPASSLKAKIRRLLGCICNALFATDLVACGELAGDRVFGKRHMRSPKAHVLLNGVDRDTFSFRWEARETIREELGIRDRFVIGLVGRLSPEKNQSFALKMMLAYHAVNENAVLLLIGNGPDEDKLKHFVAEHDMTSYVLFTGARSDVADLYSAMDVSILTSVHEGYPVVGAESLMNGLPLLLSDTVTRELERFDGVTYCTLRDTDPWIRTLKDIEKKERTLLPDETVKNTFDIVSIAKELEKIYEKRIHD